MSTLTELKNFYKDRNVYVTGITGFKGSWMALILQELGANVYGFGLKPEKKSLFNIMRIHDTASVVFTDMNTPEGRGAKIPTHFAYAHPDVVLHLAAQPLVSEGYTNPMKTYEANVMGTVLMHELARKLEYKISFVNVTTDKVYSEGDTPRLEGDRLQGLDPYSLSKSCSDMISQSYANAFDSKVIISTMRAGNVLGGGDFSPNRIVTDIVNAYANNTELHLRHPESVRPYQYVLDVVLGYLIQGMRQYKDSSLAGQFNIGPSETQIATTLTVAEEMNENLNNKISIVNDGNSIGHENPMLLLNSDKFRTQANWVPAKKTIEDVLKSTALWYNCYVNNKDDISDYTKRQVKEILNEYDY